MHMINISYIKKTGIANAIANAIPVSDQIFLSGCFLNSNFALLLHKAVS